MPKIVDPVSGELGMEGGGVGEGGRTSAVSSLQITELSSCTVMVESRRVVLQLITSLWGFSKSTGDIPATFGIFMYIARDITPRIHYLF